MNFQLCFMFLLVFRWGWPALISGLRICFPKSGRTIPAATLPCRASACAFTPFDGATPAFSRCSRSSFQSEEVGFGVALIGSVNR